MQEEYIFFSFLTFALKISNRYSSITLLAVAFYCLNAYTNFNCHSTLHDFFLATLTDFFSSVYLFSTIETWGSGDLRLLYGSLA